MAGEYPTPVTITLSPEEYRSLKEKVEVEAWDWLAEHRFSLVLHEDGYYQVLTSRGIVLSTGLPPVQVVTMGQYALAVCSPKKHSPNARPLRRSEDG